MMTADRTSLPAQIEPEAIEPKLVEHERADFRGCRKRLLTRLAMALAALSWVAPIPAAQAAEEPQPSWLKRPLVGLISMGPGGFDPAQNDNAAFGIYGNNLADVAAKRNAFDGVVINIPWAEIQPNGPSDFQSSSIDGALVRIRAYNWDPRTTVPLRALLRIWAGPNAPDWAKHLDGPPITLFFGGPRSGEAYTAGHFWASGYRRAWRWLQDRLANRYDSDPLIAEVSNSSCTTDDDEPFALSRYYDQALGVSAIANLHAAGFTDAAYEVCLDRSEDDYAGWATTPINLPFNPIFLSDNTGPYQQPVKNSDFSVALITQWRTDLGARGVLSNHNLSNPLRSTNAAIYAAERSLGAPIEFQTASPSGLDWPGTLQQAACLGSHAVELWNATDAGGYVDFPASTLIQWSHALKQSPPTSTCGGTN